MKKELDELLCKKYPKLFVERNFTPQKSSMHWGFSHDDGWFFIIDNLCDSIQKHIDEHNTWIEKYGNEYYDENPNLKREKPIHQVIVKQVKEKFGILRFYYDGGDDIIKGMVRLAEHMSEGVCEKCGSTKNIVTAGKHWIRTLCMDCRPDDEKELHKQIMEGKEVNTEWWTFTGKK